MRLPPGTIIHPVVLILLLICSCQKVERQPAHEKPLPFVVANSSVNRAVITPEDVVQFTITVNSDSKMNVLIPEVDKKFSGLRVIDYETNQEKTRDHRIIKKAVYKLKADLIGSYLLPEVVIPYTTSTGEKQTVKVAPIFLEVKTPESLQAEEENDIRDIKALYLIPKDFIWLIYSAGAVFLFGMGLMIWKWKKKKNTISLPAVPPEEIALARLHALRMKWEAREILFKALHYELSETIRVYLEGQYRFRATDMTFDEIRQKLKTMTDIGIAEKSILLNFLGQTDRVKFTVFAPSDSETNSLIILALSFIEQTLRPSGGGVCSPQASNEPVTVSHGNTA
jgi:hypothetical protein